MREKKKEVSKKKAVPKKKYILGLIVIIGFFLVLLGGFYSSYATMDPVSSVSILSQTLNYNEREPGSYKIEKSAKWVGKDQARVTIDIDTVQKKEQKYTDLILLMDISESMREKKLEQAKKAMSLVFDEFLSTVGNKVSLITFSKTADILTDLTDDKERLENSVAGIYDKDGRSLYQGFLKVNDVLENYQYEKGRTCVVVVVTAGTPNRDNPNEKGYYTYLKEKYPYLVVNLVRYAGYGWVEETLKEVSDHQYIAGLDTLDQELNKASIVPDSYDRFQVEERIDHSYFEVEDEKKIEVTQGKISLDKESQTITWNLDYMDTGKSPQMTIDIGLKEKYQKVEGVYPTSKGIKIESEVGEITEEIEETKTPRIKNQYTVIYEGNTPSGCVVSNIPEMEKRYVYENVVVGEQISCAGYQFKGWKIVTEGVKRPSEEYFIMPEGDVLLRGEWSKLTITKAMNGDVYQYSPPILRSVGAYENVDIWKYKSSITKVIFQNRINDIKEAIETFDLSETKNWGVVGYIVPNHEEGEVTYTAYIQGDTKILLNPNSSYLFHQFDKLSSIEGMEYLDTRKVTNMRNMFSYCGLLTAVNLSNFDTSKVTDMSQIFLSCRSLTVLDLSSFDTSQVTDMNRMFGDCRSLTNLDLSNFNTSQVTNMSLMFWDCYAFTAIDLSSFDTSNVTNMSNMFSASHTLTIDLSSFDTSKVTNMSQMFSYCGFLTNIDLSNFNTSNVTTMTGMFWNCYTLTELDLSNFDTSSVTNMSQMFLECSKLTTLDMEFNTSKVTNMNQMFANCSLLRTIDLSNFNTSSVTNMSQMFSNCKVLTELDLSNFDTANVTNMSYMFSYCCVLSTLDLSSFDTSKVANMTGLFLACGELTSLDLTNFNTANVTKFQYMFFNCVALTHISLTSFDTSQGTTMEKMFAGCYSLNTLDLSTFDTSNVVNMSNLFENCSGFETIDLSNFDTSKVTDMRYMFSGCWGLKDLKLTNFDTSNVVDMRNMFTECTSLVNIDINTLDTSQVTTMENMFKLCYKLNFEITISNPNLTGYDSMFLDACTMGESKIVVNYRENTFDLVDLLINTKSSNSNIVRGTLIA